VTLALVHSRDPIGMTLPRNLEAEQAVLGCAMFDNAAVADWIHTLGQKHFHEPFHGLLWGAIADLIRRGRLAEPTTLMDRFAADPAFRELGGVRYLADLVDRAPPTGFLAEYAGILIDTAQRRDLIRLCADVSARAANMAEPRSVDALVSDLERGALEAVSGGCDDEWLDAADVVSEAVTEAKERKGRIELSTGLRDLDALTGGFRRGEMAVIAGRPAMGKSAAGLAIARGLAASGMGVAFYSMEMPKSPLGLRMAADLVYDRHAPMFSGRSSNPSPFRANRNELEPYQWEALQEARRRMAGWPLAFDIRPGKTVSSMEASARRLFRQWERRGVTPGAIIVDHLTIARADQDRRGNKVAEVGDISRGLAEMAKRLDVSVIALCQLSREVDKRDNKDRRPNLSDLRWSGEIEQDARQVMFLYRPEYYCKPPEDETDIEAMVDYRARLEKVRRKLFWLVEKNNNGPTGQVETFCDIECSAIRDLQP
jgi:replicative DNA helicase